MNLFSINLKVTSFRVSFALGYIFVSKKIVLFRRDIYNFAVSLNNDAVSFGQLGHCPEVFKDFFHAQLI